MPPPVFRLLLGMSRRDSQMAGAFSVETVSGGVAGNKFFFGGGEGGKMLFEKSIFTRKMRFFHRHRMPPI